MPAKKKTSAKRAPATVKAEERESGLLRFFAYQEESITAPYRLSIDEYARQTGKTYQGSSECLLTCQTERRAHVVTMSASLRQGALVIRKDAEVWRDVTTAMRKRFGQDSALAEKDQKRIITPADDDKGRLLDLDAIADLLETGKLEAKVFWGRAADDFSLHQIFAANPDTARGATANRVFWDEAFLTPEFIECLRALRRMIARRQKARLKIASTPPIVSSHGSWDMLYTEAEFPTNAAGNWRKSKAGEGEQAIPILRVSAYDAEAVGVKEYDEMTGKPITIAEARAKSNDKDGFDREALLVYRSTGSVVIPYSCLIRAQRDGKDTGMALDLGNISELNELRSDEALRAALRERIPMRWAGYVKPLKEVGVGHDQSTSDKEGISNPSTLVIIQESGIFRNMRLCVRWLSRFPRVNEELIRMVLHDLKGTGARMKGMGIDASNEVFHAQRLQGLFANVLPVHLFKSGEKHPTRPTNWKDHLGSQYGQLFVDNLMTLPPNAEGRDADWILADHSLAVKGPTGITNLTSRGNHGDVLDGKLAAEVLENGLITPEVYGADAGEVTTRQRSEGNINDPEGFLIGVATDDYGGGETFS